VSYQPPERRFPKPASYQRQVPRRVPEESVKVVPHPKAPDYIEPMLGWRSWRIHEGVLGSVAQSDHIWKTTPQRAYCLAGIPASWAEFLPSHEAPHMGCACGYYATKTYLQLREQMPTYRYDFFVIGVVAMWGRVIDYTRGYRAEYAHPLLLIGMPDSRIFGYHRRLQRIAQMYNVPTYAAPRVGKEGWSQFLSSLILNDVGKDGPDLDEIKEKVIIKNRLKRLGPNPKPPWVQ
jgi:hypothetical protein